MKEIRAKKRFGQNFLKDKTILLKIIESMPQENTQVVEIGPGLGDLTAILVKDKDVRAYEVDTDLISILKSKFAVELGNEKLELVHTDVLEAWDERKTLYDGGYNLIANLPYYIATNIILRAFEDKNCEHMIVMLQKEVAKKFSANEGDKEFSSLSVIAKTLSKDSRILFDVPPESFEPSPKVMSSILYIKKDMTKSIDKDFMKFLKACFIQPRKKLSKNISSVIAKSLVSSIFKELNLDDNIRPHQISASLYSQIYKKVVNYGRSKEYSDTK